MKNISFSAAEQPNPRSLRRYKWLGLGWLAGCLLLAAMLLLLIPHSRINSSVLALLPAQSVVSIPAPLRDGFLQRLDRQLVWMVSSGKTADPRVPQQWLDMLRQQPEFQHITGSMDALTQQEWGKFLYLHRNGNLDAQTRARLQQGGATQAQWVLSQLYSAFAGVSGTELRNDPLMLLRGAQLALSQQAGQQLQLMNGWLVAQDEQHNYWYLLHGQLRDNPFDIQKNHHTVTLLTGLQQQLQSQYPQAQILSRGTLFYSDRASTQAKHDISTLGTGTVLAVICLIFLAFRSLRPLLLCLLSIASGALAGTVAVLLLYGELHLLTLVMSISIVGISADYTLYYLTDRMVHGGQISRWQSLHKVRPALLLALLTTVAAYLIMMLAPFPGIRQLALFSAVGLTAACISVICWHPWLCAGLAQRPVPAQGLLLRWLLAWRQQKSLRIGLPVLLALLAAVGISRLHINDDISQLQALPADLYIQDQKITALTGQSIEQKGIIVTGDDPQHTLQRMEQLQPLLQQAEQQQLITSFRMLPLNSLQRQQQDLQLIKQATPVLQQVLATAGITDIEVDSSPMYITVKDWLNSPVSAGWRLLWLTLDDGQSAVFIPLQGVRNSTALAQLIQQQVANQPHSQITLFDRKADIDHLFSLYRQLFSGLLLVALLVIALAALLRLGWRKGLITLVPSVLSLACGLATLALSGQSVTLFALLALALVLGIGVNYTLFFGNPRGTPLTSLLAVTLAMLTTLLTLGMLVFSTTQAISSFGIVLCGGIFTAFLLSPLAMPEKKRSKQEQ